MKKHLPFLLCLLVVVFLSGYKLTESPPTWMDEGIFMQVSRNMALHGEHGVQVAPEEFAKGSYITTAYPVTGPVAASFMMFGTGILQARVVMVLFIIIFFCTLYAILRRKMEGIPLFLTLLLVALFAPLYGHGRNVLGEVPAMTYLFLGYLFFVRIFEGRRAWYEYAGAGVFVALAIVTKPIFILIAPALIVSVFLYRKNMFSEQKTWIPFVIAFLIPVAIWMGVQFTGDSLATILEHYGNPNRMDLWQSIQMNVKRFFTEAQPFYTLALFVLWTAALGIRWKKGASWRDSVSVIECMSWMISFLMLLMYVRTAGFYRYFFTAELLALVFIIPSSLEALRHIAPDKIKYRNALLTFFAVLVLIHAKQTFSGSWVFAYLEGTRSALLEEHVGKMGEEKMTFFYQAPEAVNFLPQGNDNYYQYFAINTELEIGADQKVLLEKKIPDIVVTNGDLKDAPQFRKYTLSETFDKYVIFTK